MHWDKMHLDGAIITGDLVSRKIILIAPWNAVFLAILCKKQGGCIPKP